MRREGAGPLQVLGREDEEVAGDLEEQRPCEVAQGVVHRTGVLQPICARQDVPSRLICFPERARLQSGVRAKFIHVVYASTDVLYLALDLVWPPALEQNRRHDQNTAKEEKLSR